MARGWESKAIEAQQEEAARAGARSPVLNDADRAALERRRSLELTRTRVRDDLSRARVPAHRRMLEQTLAVIEEQLREIQARQS